MAAPRTTVWDLEPHTRAKHEILRRYLDAWTAILTRGGFPQILYIDGFAGPGRYSKGEDGSPVIALKAAMNAAIPSTCKAFYLFVEKDQARADMLESIVQHLGVPAHLRVKVAGGQTFEAAFEELMGKYRVAGRPVPPTFAFIDPFGWTGKPFSAIREILSHQHCEVLVTFMYEEINRFIAHPDQADNFDRLFGCGNWREAIGLAAPAARRRFLHDLYLAQLQSDDGAAASFVRSFEMRNDSDVTDYFLFYATNSLLGLRKMKEAMWKVDPDGEFRFSDATNQDQLVLFGREPAHDILRRQLRERFGGHEVTVTEVEHFVLAETAFVNFKQEGLRPLEMANPPAVTAVDPPARRRRGTYADPLLRLRFAPQG